MGDDKKHLQCAQLVGHCHVALNRIHALGSAYQLEEVTCQLMSHITCWLKIIPQGLNYGVL